MISNRKFLVSKDIHLDEFKTNGPTRLNRLLVASALTTSKNVYLFDDLAQAKDFARTRGGAQAERGKMGIFSMIGGLTDYPIFEVNIEHVVTEPRLHKKVKDYSSSIKESRILTLKKDTTYQAVKELFLQQENIIAAHSSFDINYAIDELKFTGSSCALM